MAERRPGMVAENEGEPRKIAVTVWLSPEEIAGAERTARRYEVDLAEALGWWAFLMALAHWLPHGPEAALVKLWFTHAYPKRKEPPCR
jgi:hypothetical protein